MPRHRWSDRHDVLAAFLKTSAPVVAVAILIGGLIAILFIVDQREPVERALPRIGQACVRLQQLPVAGGRVFCTHGGDPEPAPGSADAALICILGFCPTPSPTPSAPPRPVTYACTTEATPRGVQIVYGHPSDRPDVSRDWIPTIREIAVRMDRELASRNIRWACDSGGSPLIRRVTLPAVGSDGAYTFRNYMDGVRAQSWGRDGNRAFLGFVSGVTSEYPFGGQATIWDDDRNVVNNVNNFGPMYSMVDHLSWTGALHELGHNLGAVQCSAPHSTCNGGNHHCWDENDILCYFDGGPPMRRICDVSTPLFDCRRDDYYNPAPQPGTYLYSHWNTASSAFLVRE